MQKMPQAPVAPECDLRDMVRRYVIDRSLQYMKQAVERRRTAVADGNTRQYIEQIRDIVRSFYGELPVGNAVPAPKVTKCSTYEKDGYRMENVLFDSFPGWQVNATVYIPTDYEPPVPAVIVPVGHSGKQFESYQLPCQFFARSGYVAVTFDPPGQASEKQPGNDHFVDGVRCYLIGETSSRYFVADALRCVDYLANRDDIDMTNGVAMTGVSGGGTTTTLAGLLDERITVLGPSCCLTRLEDLDITQCYAGCPETHMWRRYAEGIDEIDLVCAAAPKPVLLMAGVSDEVFRIEDTRSLSVEITEFYEASGVDDRYMMYEDDGGHAYTLAQARKFTQFMSRWLRGKPDSPVCDLPDDTFQMNPYKELLCYPRADVNMYSLTLERAIKLEGIRSDSTDSILSSAKTISGVDDTVAAPRVRKGDRFQVWMHDWQQIMLHPEEGIELPVTMLLPVTDTPSPTVLHFDDRGRHTNLKQNGLLASAVRFCERDERNFGLMTVDLRGWGDTEPALYPYEVAGWGSTDRYTAYATAAVGDHIMSMRIRDGLAALRYLQSCPEVDSDRIVLTGSGLGEIVALHIAAVEQSVAGVVTWNGLHSFMSLLAEEHYTWPADAFLPNVLLHYDLPELSNALMCPVKRFNMLDGRGQPVDSEQADRGTIVNEIHRLLET